MSVPERMNPNNRLKLCQFCGIKGVSPRNDRGIIMSVIERTRRVNFMIEEETLEHIQERLGLQSLASVNRRLLLLYVNDDVVRARVKALDVDTQAGYEKLQQNQ